MTTEPQFMPIASLAVVMSLTDEQLSQQRTAYADKLAHFEAVVEARKTAGRNTERSVYVKHHLIAVMRWIAQEVARRQHAQQNAPHSAKARRAEANQKAAEAKLEAKRLNIELQPQAIKAKEANKQAMIDRLWAENAMLKAQLSLLMAGSDQKELKT